MKLLNKRLIFLLSIFLVSSCSSKDITSKGNLYFENTQLKNSKYSLKGKIDFSNFRIKSDNAVSFVLSSTVSLLYPSNYSNQELRNTTIGTNISDVNHNFTINPISSFIPELNQIYILEASRRVYSNEESPLNCS